MTTSEVLDHVPLTQKIMEKQGKKPQKRYASRSLIASGITAEQEAYCRARAMGMSTVEAISFTGIQKTAGTCRNWESLPQIRNRIEEISGFATKNAIINTGLDREWVISRLMTVVDRCLQAEPVTDNEGAPTGEYTFNAAGANQALRMLGDTMGMFKPTDKKPEDDYANLSDDDLRRIAAELAAQTGILELKP